MFDFCIQAFDLVLGTFENFVRERSCKTDHQIRITQFILQASRWFDEDLLTTFIRFTQILLLALHTFIAAQYDHTHKNPRIGLVRIS